MIEPISCVIESNKKKFKNMQAKDVDDDDDNRHAHQAALMQVRRLPNSRATTHSQHTNATRIRRRHRHSL